MSDHELDKFTVSYIETALWAEGYGLEYDEDWIDENDLKEIISDCKDFQEQAHELIEGHEIQASHDFYLTRNGHGSGFWDGDWPEEDGEKLTEISKSYGAHQAFLADDMADDFDTIYFHS